MPSGYTSDIYNNKKTTFKQFALKCARAMGALIMFREHRSEYKIDPEKDFEPSSYHQERLKEDEEENK